MPQAYLSDIVAALLDDKNSSVNLEIQSELTVYDAEDLIWSSNWAVPALPFARVPFPPTIKVPPTQH